MSVRRVAPAFSPLDEQLGLSPSCRCGPRVLQWLVRLGAELPFARAAFWIEELLGIVVSAATVRRQTEAVGATAVALADAEVARIERETPPPVTHPEQLVVGADGAMVGLVAGEWAEVKLLSVGRPQARGDRPGAQLRLHSLAYFARLADAETFGRQALGELHRAGLDGARSVAAVQDGAPWLQGFVDYHRPDALRILDWPHAVEHLSGLCETLFGVGTPRAGRARERLRRWLWEEGPDRVLAILAGWQRARPDLASAVAYFRERRAQLDYPAFRAAGWPVGSGATESGHKQVMQARMKQAGMRWERSHVNPMLALTLLEHNDRWASEGSALFAQHRGSCRAQHRQRHQRRRLARYAPPGVIGPVAPAGLPPAPSPEPAAVGALPSGPAARHPHPWRRYGPWLSVKI